MTDQRECPCCGNNMKSEETTSITVNKKSEEYIDVDDLTFDISEDMGDSDVMSIDICHTCFAEGKHIK